MRDLPLVMHYGNDFDSTESQFLRDMYDKQQHQNGR